MTLTDGLRLRAGEKLAFVGCGGKTSLIRLLASENAAGGALIAPTTRIALSEMTAIPNVRYLGCAEDGKLRAAPMSEIEAAARSVPLSLFEADGSKRLPLKGWAAHEPVVPPFATRTVGVVSARAAGLIAAEQNVHRLPLFLAQVGLAAGATVDEAAIARMIAYCLRLHAVGERVVLVNQADNPGLVSRARRIADALAGEIDAVLIGSAWEADSWTRAW